MLASLPDDTAAVVVARDTDLGAAEPLDVSRDEWLRHGDALVRFVSSGSVTSWWKAIKAVRSFRPDIVYVNSFFDHLFSVVPQLLVRLSVFGRAAVLLAPRGEFSEGALALHPRRKRVGLALFRVFGLGRGVTWHASAPPERDDIRRVIGPHVDVIVRENDTDLPTQALAVPERGDGPLRVVHVSRLSAKKGLDILLTALSGVKKPLRLDVFGPVEDVRFGDRCRRLADALPAHITVTFGGPLDRDLVRSTLTTYDLMAFPTRGENFGHVIAESLSVSCPVMCPDNTPWSAVLRGGGGVVVDPDTVEHWTRCVDEFAALVPHELMIRRRGAATAYEDWRRAAAEQPHLFSIVERRSVAT